MNSIAGPLLLLQNSGARGHWLEVKTNGFAPGTKITAVLPGGRRLVRELHAGSSYLSSEDPRAHFGLGAANEGRRADRALPRRQRDAAPRRSRRPDPRAARRRVPACEDTDVLTADAVDFLTELERTFGPRRRELLARAARAGAAAARRRAARLPARDGGDPRRRLARRAGRRPSCRTAASRSPGPVDRKMVINALNSGAKMFMADFEDSNSPTWQNCIEGQVNLTDALDRTISLDTGEKQYSLNEETATLLVRPRGWHLRGAALRGRRRADVGEPVRLRPLLLPQPRPRRHVVLPAEARVAPRGAALERRLRSGRRSGSASRRGRSRRPS